MHALTDLGKADNVMDALFGLEMEEEFSCEESGESKVSTSTAKKLVCNIQGGAGASTQVKTGGVLSYVFIGCLPFLSKLT